jgi:anti-anti-sigma factor
MIMPAFEHRLETDVHVLTPKRNLVGGQETVTLASAIAAFDDPQQLKVVLDLRRIDWVSSLGVEELRRIHYTCTQRNGWMRLACVGERINNIILTMRLDWVFDSFDTVDEAVTAPSRIRRAF